MTDRALLAAWSLAATLSPLTSGHSGRPRRTRCGRNGPGSTMGALNVCRSRAGRETPDPLLGCVEFSRLPVSFPEHLVSVGLGFRLHLSPENPASPLDGPGLCEILGLVLHSCRVRA